MPDSFKSLQHTTNHCNTKSNLIKGSQTHVLQHTATHCNTLQHTATHCNTKSNLIKRSKTHYITNERQTSKRSKERGNK